MKKAIFLFLTFGSTHLVFAQKDIPAFGKIDIADLQMKSCSFEPDANAMKLIDLEETELDWYTYTMREKSEIRVRIKIFNEKGFKHASIRIPYFSKKGVAKIKELSGVVYSLGSDGKVVTQKLDKKDFLKEKTVENVGFVNFTFPNLRPGCVIEYKYTTVENGAWGVSPWHIQDKIPVQYSSKIVKTPVQYRIVERPYGIDSLKKIWYLTKNDQYRTLIFYHENTPSFKIEPFMSSINDHRIKASFILFPRGGAFEMSPVYTDLMWASAAKGFINSGFFATHISKPIPGTEKVYDTALKIPVLKDRIGFIYKEVKKAIPDKVEQTLSADNLNLEEVWKNKAGTSTEINLVLLNLLLKADVPCMPVMVSTKTHGKVNKDFPSVSQFNGFDVLALDSNGYYLLDASIKYQSYLNPPLNVMNREVFLIGKDSAQWLDVTDNRYLSKQTINVIADLDKDEKMEGTATIQYFDYAKSYKLDTTLNSDTDAEDRFYDKNPDGLKIVSTTRAEIGSDEDPLYETIDFSYEPQKSNDFIFINPQILTQLNRNPFIAENRYTDIDFGCNQFVTLNMQVNLPSNFEIEHLPENMILRSPDSSMMYSITYMTDSKKIYVAQTFQTNRSIYTKEEYSVIKDFFKQMHALMTKEIILKNKK